MLVVSDNARHEVVRSTTACRLCGSGDLDSVISLGNLYVNAFPKTPDPALPRAPLHLVRCAKCGLAQLADTVAPDLLYRETFWYRSAVNSTMRYHLAELVRESSVALDRLGGPRAWLDIGANDGYLLEEVGGQWAGCRRVGVEPARNLRDECLLHADEVISDYFKADSLAGQKFDIITSVAMFYDLDDPHAFVQDVLKVLAPKGIWVNQLSYTPTMLRRTAFDNLCHEHLCYYDLTTLSRLYHQHGLTVRGVEFNDINGGSFRVYAQRKDEVGPTWGQVGQLLRCELEDANQAAYQGFAQRVEKWQRQVPLLLSALPQPIHVYGASTKGNTLLQFMGTWTGLFSAAADRNPDKWGRFMVGSNLPIISEEDSRAKLPGTYFVLPWAFREEFLKREQAFRDRGGILVFPLPNFEVCL